MQALDKAGNVRSSKSIFKLNIEKITGLINGVNDRMPMEYVFYQNYPNPFNPTTEIRFKLPKTERVKLTVYNPKRELVRLLFDETAERGEHILAWNGLDDIGRQVPGGINFLKMSCKSFNKVIKMSFVK